MCLMTILSSSDRRLYQQIAYRQILSKAMLNESLSVKEKCEKGYF